MVALLLLVVAGTQAYGCLDGHGETAVLAAASHDSPCPPSEGHVHSRPLSAVAVRSEGSPSIPDSVPPLSVSRVFPDFTEGSPRSPAFDRSGPRILTELCVSRT
ncbi:hypothetical protein ACFQ05_19690 [Amycolatopsis umgeniensis]|uniref:Uncharacterized protein n=1 Tax=Amycolatopsis umgeniensis TaxID=336628 RepID=A0A841BGD0_9PSEU|nr:hypothetical protein [Amycolatopsis umgeniensis]